MQPTKPYAFGSIVGTAFPPLPPPPSVAKSEIVEEGEVLTKIVDWTAVGWSVFELTICSIGGLLGLGTRMGLSAILLPGALVSGVVLFQKLAGVKFDSGRGTLRFYSFWLPREVRLADIRDANCEFAITVSPSRIALGLCGASRNGKPRGRGAATQRTYMVNLSGSFGSRQVRFYSKRWRDRFLSTLRDQAPRCRITRWF